MINGPHTIPKIIYTQIARINWNLGGDLLQGYYTKISSISMHNKLNI